MFGLSPDHWMTRGILACLLILTRFFPNLFGYQVMFVARSNRRGRKD
jgi:hypothetical protein